MIERESSSQHMSRSFKHWVKKETLLEEKRRLLRLLKRKDQLMQQYADDASVRDKALKDCNKWNQSQVTAVWSLVGGVSNWATQLLISF